MIKNKHSITLILSIIILTTLACGAGENIVKDNYEISASTINRSIEPQDYFRDFIEVKNKAASPMTLSFKFSDTLNSIVTLEDSTLEIPAQESGKAYFIIQGIGETYEGTLTISGSVDESIPVEVRVEESNTTNAFLLTLTSLKDTFLLNKEIYFRTDIKILDSNPVENVTFTYTLEYNNQTYPLDNFTMSFNNSKSFMTSYQIPDGIDPGEAIVFVETDYEGFELKDSAYFLLERAFMQKKLFGFLKMWILVVLLSLLAVGAAAFIFIKRYIASKKKYNMSVDLKTLPPKSNENLFLGKLAETNHFFYYDPNKFTTHAIVAGATGGGKSITAQVIIEECLKKDIAVIVFDPTAQWSGMLRKSTDKKMMSFYPQFGLKKQDAQAFKGNVRMVKNSRQVIDINKYVAPGQIQIFSLNKLDPKEMDIFVASIIRQIFKNDPKEYPGLKTLLVFDEVHRLLPKFGGSGAGFVQIERACREFRKWGLGIFLVSQVLNDFVGEIKANISTEVQMRTRDEGDLKRIETKNGPEFLQSLVKASAGVGMLSNPAYNHANPFFVQFRPILHSTKRLEDEELEKYNKYNDQVDELEFQIDELEKEKVDVFDFKMELKLVKDKIMSGSFSVVEIYLDGLKPRVQKEWEKLGKKPPEMKIELVSEAEIQESIEKAKADSAKAKAAAGAAAPAAGGGAAAPAEENPAEKIVASLTFDNGAMISSLKELKDYLPNMDDADFAVHVNKEKNDILKWVKEQFGDEIAKGIEGKAAKADIAKALEEICKGKDSKPAEAPKEGEPAPAEEKKEE